MIAATQPLRRAAFLLAAILLIGIRGSGHGATSGPARPIDLGTLGGSFSSAFVGDSGSRGSVETHAVLWFVPR